MTPTGMSKQEKLCIKAWKRRVWSGKIAGALVRRDVEELLLLSQSSVVTREYKRED